MSTTPTTTIRPRIDASWTLVRAADGSIAIVRQWHFRSGDAVPHEPARHSADVSPPSAAFVE